MALWTTEDIFAAEAFWRETAEARYHDGLAALRRQHTAAATAVHNAASVPTSTVRLSPSPDRPQRHYYGRPSQEPPLAHTSAHASPAAKYDDGLSLRRLSSSRGDTSRSPSGHRPPFDASTRLSEPAAAASPGAANRAARFHPSQRSVPHEARPTATRTDAHQAGGHRRLPSPELDTPQRPSAASPPGRRSETQPPGAPEPAAVPAAFRRSSHQHEAPSAAIAVWRRRLQRTEALEAACRAELRRVAAEDLLLAIGPALPTDPSMAPHADAQRREGTTTQARPVEPAPTRLFEGGGESTPDHPRPASTGPPALAPEPPAAGESWRGSGVPFEAHVAAHAAAPAHATFHEDELLEPRSPGAVLPRSVSNALSIASSAAAYARNPELVRQHAALPPTLGPSPHVVEGHDAPGLDDLPSVVSRLRDEGSEALSRRPSIWADGSSVHEQAPDPSPRPEGATLLSTASAAAVMDAASSAGPQHDTLDTAGSVFAASTVLSAGPMGSAAAQGGEDDGVFVSRLLGCAVNTRLELQPLRAAPDGCLVAAPSPALAFRPRDVLATAGGTPILTLPALRRWESAVAAAGRGVRPAVVVVLRADGGRGPRKIPVSLRELT